MRRLTYRAHAPDAAERLVTAGHLRFADESGSWQDAAARRLCVWVRSSLEKNRIVELLGPPDEDSREALADDALDQWRERIAPRTWVLGKAAAVPRDATHIVRLGVGYGFGLGDHPTTRCAASLLVARGCARQRVLDLGSGTGVLAALAGLLKARTVDAVDLDTDSVRHTRDTLRRNHLTAQVWRSNLLRQVPDSYHLVVANLVSDLLVELFATGTLPCAVRRGGAVICSGIRYDKRPWVESAARADGWQVTQRNRHRDWVGLVLERA